jgi:Fic family protein
MRTYKKTHPWLQFSVDLRLASTLFWVLLGECQSKCEHLADAPLLPRTQEELLRIYLAKGVLATSAIEGNTLTEEQVQDHLEGKLHLPPSKEYLAREIDNVVKACNLIVWLIQEGVEPPKLSAAEIKAMNLIILEGLTVDDHVVPGELRTMSVGVPGYRGAPAEDCEYLVERLCGWLNEENFPSPPGMKIAFAVIKAVLAHLYLAWIHPFGDGNGRTARMVEFRILMSSGVPHPAAHLLSNHYNQTRSQYYHELKRASQSKGDVVPFLLYAVQGFLDGLRQQVRAIQAQQWEVVWRDYVYQSFQGQSGDSNDRRRRLVFALSKQDGPVGLGEIPDLSPQLARLYAHKTRKTLARDVNECVAKGLLVKEKGKVRIRKESIAGFASIAVP